MLVKIKCILYNANYDLVLTVLSPWMMLTPHNTCIHLLSDLLSRALAVTCESKSHKAKRKQRNRQ